MILTDNKFLELYQCSGVKKHFKPINMKKIAFCGSSGCGKTTLAKIISKESGIPYVSMSQKDLFDPEILEVFKDQTNQLYKPDISHQMLIYLSQRFPNFGYNFQLEVLKRRTKLIESMDSFITDRSPIDNLVYFITQVGAQTDREKWGGFLAEVKQALSQLDLVVLLNPNPDHYVEDDKVRIINYYYQLFIHSTFNFALLEFIDHSKTNPHIMQIREWDLDKRVEIILKVTGFKGEF